MQQQQYLQQQQQQQQQQHLPYSFKASQYTVPSLIPGSGKLVPHNIESNSSMNPYTPTKSPNTSTALTPSSKIKMKINQSLFTNAVTPDQQQLLRMPSLDPVKSDRTQLQKQSSSSNITSKILSSIISPTQDSLKYNRTIKTPDGSNKQRHSSGQKPDLFYTSKSMKTLPADPMSLSNISLNSSFQHHQNLSMNSFDLRILSSHRQIPSMAELSSTPQSLAGHQQHQFPTITQQIREKKQQLQEMKVQAESIQSKISNSHHVSNINSMVENALNAKYEQSNKRLQSYQNDLAEKQEELVKIDASATKHKQLISNLQSKLEIIKQQEQRYEILKEKKLREVQNQFDKKQAEMAAMVDEVTEQYARFEENLIMLHEAYHIDQETKSMMKEDLNSKLIQRAELVAEKEDLEQLFEHFTQTYVDEYEYLTELVRIGSQISSLTDSLSGFATDEIELSEIIQQLSGRLESGESYATHYTSKLQYIESRIAFEKEQPLVELNMAQDELDRLTSSEFNHLPSLDEMSEEILREQNQQIVGLSSIENLIAVLMEGGEIVLQRILDGFALKYFGGQFLNESQAYFMETLCKLFVSLVCIEQVNARFGDELQQFSVLVVKHSGEAEEIRRELVAKQARLDYLRSTVQRDQQNLKRVEQAKLVLEENLKISARKRGDAVFEKYCNEQRQQLEDIRAERGDLYVEQVKEQHREEFYHLMELQQQDRLQRMSRVNDDKQKIENRFRENVQCVEQEIVPILNEIQIDLFAQKDQLDLMEADRESYEDTKKNVMEDARLLEECLYSKQQEIIRNLQGQFADVIGKSAAIEQELNQEIEQFKECVEIIDAMQIAIAQLQEQEQELLEDIMRTQEKKKVVEGVRSQSVSGWNNKGTLDDELAMKQKDIADLETELSQLEMAQQLGGLNESNTPKKIWGQPPTGMGLTTFQQPNQQQYSRSHTNSLHNQSDRGDGGRNNNSFYENNAQSQRYYPDTLSPISQQQQIGAVPKTKLISTSFVNTLRKDELNDSMNSGMNSTNRMSSQRSAGKPSQDIIVSQLIGQRVPSVYDNPIEQQPVGQFLPFMKRNIENNQPMEQYSGRDDVLNSNIYGKSGINQPILSQQGISYNFNYNSKPQQNFTQETWKQ